MKLFSSRIARISLGAVVVILIAWYFMHGRGDGTRFVTAPVTSGSIVRSVAATGTVNPVTTVQVGTYVSGPITQISADFNSPVKQGQIIAKIDPRPYAATVALSTAAVANAKAQLLKDQANLAYQKVTYERDKKLLAEQVDSQDQVDSQFNTYNQAVAQIALDRAAIDQQEATLKQAQLNLNYTDIRSPVDGTVVARNVDVGQTVAASFQTPVLFLVAQDLTKMQVDASVSESDIGYVKKGEPADFKVDAFPDRMFQGTVGQVRQAPITVQNVVTYDVVVNVDNPELLLKPGMTANVTITTARRDQVVRLPLDALRFKPRGKKVVASAADPGSGSDASPSRNTQVWIPSGGSIEPVTVNVGLDDGVNAEVLSGALKPGDLVVTDEVQTAQSAKRTSLHFPH
ncbi:MAG: efflux RND transporter periplasmic adaptor subunit [Candidatus Binataceae bacterium]